MQEKLRSMGNLFGENSAKSSKPQQPGSGKPRRPDSARGDKQFNIKTNTGKNETAKLLNEKRQQRNNKDLIGSAEQANCLVGHRTTSNWIDPSQSPGLDLLFRKFDEQVISAVTKDSPADTANKEYLLSKVQSEQTL